jgi:allantoate deiminase
VTLNANANRRLIDPGRVESSIQALAQYGAHGETGVARLVYSPEWVAAQDQVAAWMEEAGLRVERDAVGNVWGYLDGRGRERPIVATGSHIDSQNPGGRFDGALGVVAGILAVGALRERHGQPRQTIGVVSLVEGKPHGSRPQTSGGRGRSWGELPRRSPGACVATTA